MKLNEITQKDFAAALKDPEKYKFTSKLPALKDKAHEFGVAMANFAFVQAANGVTIGMKFRTSTLSNVPMYKEKLLKIDTAIRHAYEEEFEVDVYMIGDRFRAYEIWEGKDDES